jgi:hypothetical protein
MIQPYQGWCTWNEMIINFSTSQTTDLAIDFAIAYIVGTYSPSMGQIRVLLDGAVVAGPYDVPNDGYGYGKISEGVTVNNVGPGSHVVQLQGRCYGTWGDYIINDASLSYMGRWLYVAVSAVSGGIGGKVEARMGVCKT